MDETGLRLRHFLNTEEIEQKKVAHAMGCAPSYINALCMGKKPVGKKTAAKLQDLFGISAAWLLTGEGSMYAQQGDDMRDEAAEFVEAITHNPSPTARPYFNVDFSASFDFLENDQTTNPDYFVDFPPYRNCDYYCNVYGNSMEPTISSGDIVAMKRVEDFRYLINGKIYAIVTSNGLRTIKRIRDNGDTFTLVPDNHAIGEQIIPKSFVTHVFLVMGSIKQF